MDARRRERVEALVHPRVLELVVADEPYQNWWPAS